MPIFSIFLATDTPLAFIGTTIRLLFRCGLPSLVLTRQHMKSACVPLVIHILVPRMM